MNPGSRTTLLRAPAVAAAVAVAVALIAVACGSGGTVTPTATVTVTASPGASGSPSPKPSKTWAPVTKQPVIAVASGPSANALAAVTPAGKVKTLVAAMAGRITSIAWSPDSARIAYVQGKSLTGGGGNVVVYDLAKGKAAPVLVGGAVPGNVAGFTWVAPTQLIVSVIYGSTTYHVNGQLYLCDVAKKSSTQVKDDTGAVVRGVWPSASSDATAIAYVRYGPAKGATQPTSLMLYDADTLSVVKVAHDSLITDIDNEHYAYPSISPDGSLIYSCSTGSDPGFGVSVCRTDGAPALTKSGLVWPAPCGWDKATGRLAFGGAKGSSFANGSLFTWKTGTSAPVAITTASKRYVSSACWSPNGASIAYALQPQSSAGADLWIVSAAGGGAHLVLKSASSPAWAVAGVAGL